ncbi:cation:H+ antiporter [Breznakibacter xylanolyticus]|uniref:Cation:H+ antiporter n=2 Tax=Breznakibacter xylanolyticus TaxID=990 RepID=A0A2W7N9N3_9BACT|nr:cation:H+ antiporter [Breznakibacter xylanolyticus]
MQTLHLNRRIYICRKRQKKMLYTLLLIAGFAALIYGAHLMIESASSLARRMNIPNIVIGLTIVAFGTSAPELIVNVFAAVNKNPEMVMGNVTGSNIFNILAILGIAALYNPLMVNRQTTWIEIPLALLAAVVMLVMASDVFLDQSATMVISRSEGIVLLMFFMIFLAYNISLSVKGGNEDEVPSKDYTIAKALMFLALGLGLLIAGGRAIVYSAVELARLAGMSERVIAITIVSIGTSLPELAASVVAARKGNVDLAIGNVVGSCIFNTFLILGASATIFPVSITPAANLDLMINIVASILLFAFLFTGKGRQIDRWEGLVFLSLYVGYISWLLMA